MKSIPSLAANWEEAKTLYISGVPAPEIALRLRCKRSTLESRFSRAGLPALRQASMQKGRADRTKEKIGRCAENIVDQLDAKTPKSAEGLNLHADTLGKVTKAAALVHGWGDQSAVQVIFPGVHLGVAEVEPEAIDIE